MAYLAQPFNILRKDLEEKGKKLNVIRKDINKINSESKRVHERAFSSALKRGASRSEAFRAGAEAKKRFISSNKRYQELRERRRVLSSKVAKDRALQREYRQASTKEQRRVLMDKYYGRGKRPSPRYVGSVRTKQRIVPVRKDDVTDFSQVEHNRDVLRERRERTEKRKALSYLEKVERLRTKEMPTRAKPYFYQWYRKKAKEGEIRETNNPPAIIDVSGNLKKEGKPYLDLPKYLVRERPIKISSNVRFADSLKNDPDYVFEYEKARYLEKQGEKVGGSIKTYETPTDITYVYEQREREYITTPDGMVIPSKRVSSGYISSTTKKPPKETQFADKHPDLIKVLPITEGFWSGQWREDEKTIAEYTTRTKIGRSILTPEILYHERDMYKQMGAKNTAFLYDIEISARERIRDQPMRSLLKFGVGMISGNIMASIASSSVKSATLIEGLGVGAGLIYGAKTYEGIKELPTREEKARAIGETIADVGLFSLGAYSGAKSAIEMGYQPQPSGFPRIKYRKFQVQTGKGMQAKVKTLYRGIETFTPSTGEGTPLVGYGQGKVFVGGKSFSGLELPKTDFVALSRESPTARLITESMLKKYNPLEYKKFKGIWEVTSETYNTPSKIWTTEFEKPRSYKYPESAEFTIGETSGEIFLKYGSVTSKPQMRAEYRSLVGESGDIDVFISQPERFGISFAKTHKTNLKEFGEPAFISKEQPMLIQTRLDGGDMHMVDIHTLYGEYEGLPPAESFFGRPFNQPSVEISGAGKLMPLSESGIRMASSITTLRGEGGVISINPEAHRLKDVSRFFAFQEELTSLAGTGKSALRDTKQLYPSNVFDSSIKSVSSPYSVASGRVLPVIALPSFMPSSKSGSINVKSLFGSPSKYDYPSVSKSVYASSSKSSYPSKYYYPSASVYSRSPSKSPSPSVYSRSPSKSPSPSVYSRSPSKSKSPSVYSRSPSKSPSPSVYSRSPSKSPSPSTPPTYIIIPKLFRLKNRKRKITIPSRKIRTRKNLYKPSILGMEIGKKIMKAPKFTTGIGIRYPVKRKKGKMFKLIGGD